MTLMLELSSVPLEMVLTGIDTVSDLGSWVDQIPLVAALNDSPATESNTNTLSGHSSACIDPSLATMTTKKQGKDQWHENTAPWHAKCLARKPQKADSASKPCASLMATMGQGKLQVYTLVGRGFKLCRDCLQLLEER